MNASTPLFTNALINESSPYLLQHAHNPVQWMPWSEQIVALATTQNKPILLSIGYAACHWCHVMERESFENEAIAAYMNAHFINVKVDREERPDIDHIYMDALQAMTGSGGWPLNIFLLPDGKPFYGGTYFPPSTLPQRASWKDVLVGVHDAFESNLEKLVEQASQLTNHLINTNIQASALTNNAASTENGSALNSKETQEIATIEEVDILANRILQGADTQWGGFGTAPKFPQTGCLQVLFRNYKMNQSESSVVHAIRSIDKMIQGGIYDHLVGGFARYSTDVQWQAPHFEKMLYDNALLIGVLSEGYQITQKEVYKNVIEQTIQFVQNELSNQVGGFYAALDADSEGVEGKFYTWTYAEIKALIDPSIVDEFCNYFQITPNGNWEHSNILWSQSSLEDSFSPAFVQAKKVLLQSRNERIRPALDYKIILAWNNLMIIGLCKAYAAVGNEEYKNLAIQSMEWVESNLYNEQDGYFYHHDAKGLKKTHAFLDDYASLIQAYIQLQEISGNTSYLFKARKWMEYVSAHFVDEADLFFYFTPNYQKDIIVRKKESYDGAQPSGNSMMCMNLYYLGHVFDHAIWTHQATQMIQHMRKMILTYPSSYSNWVHTFCMMAEGLIEVVAVGPTTPSAIITLISKFSPHKLLLFTSEEEPEIPLTIGKKSTDNQYFVCKNNTCMAPSKQLSDILALI